MRVKEGEIDGVGSDITIQTYEPNKTNETETKLKKEDVLEKARQTCMSIDSRVSVCILFGKNVGTIDLIIIRESGATSVRSVTELINNLIKECKVPYRRIVNELLPWVHSRLRYLYNQIL